MIFELVDLRTGDLAGEFDDRDEALQAIAEAVRTRGADAVAPLALRWLDPDRGHGQEIARGNALLRLALRAPDGQ